MRIRKHQTTGKEKVIQIGPYIMSKRKAQSKTIDKVTDLTKDTLALAMVIGDANKGVKEAKVKYSFKVLPPGAPKVKKRAKRAEAV